MASSGTLDREPMRRPTRATRWDDFADVDAWDIDDASDMADELLWARYDGGRATR